MTEQIMRQNLFAIAQAYADATGFAITTVSKKIHGNGEFFEGFLVGRISCGIDTYFAIVDKFRDRWPTGAKWPQTLPVPKLSRVPYRPGADMPARGKGGRFLGEKNSRRSKAGTSKVGTKLEANHGRRGDRRGSGLGPHSAAGGDGPAAARPRGRVPQ